MCRVLKFSIVTSLEKNEIVCLSGTHNHCIVVTKEGLVFTRGSNDCGQLGLGQINGISWFSTFTQVLSLRKRGIRAAYAGTGRSFFETCEGSILSCGRNYYGELLLSSGPSEDINKPSETIVNRDATFCIAKISICAFFSFIIKNISNKSYIIIIYYFKKYFKLEYKKGIVWDTFNTFLYIKLNKKFNYFFISHIILFRDGNSRLS